MHFCSQSAGTTACGGQSPESAGLGRSPSLLLAPARRQPEGRGAPLQGTRLPFPGEAQVAAAATDCGLLPCPTPRSRRHQRGSPRMRTRHTHATPGHHFGPWPPLRPPGSGCWGQSPRWAPLLPGRLPGSLLGQGRTRNGVPLWMWVEQRRGQRSSPAPTERAGGTSQQPPKGEPTSTSSSGTGPRLCPSASLGSLEARPAVCFDARGGAQSPLEVPAMPAHAQCSGEQTKHGGDRDTRRWRHRAERRQLLGGEPGAGPRACG